MIAFLKGPRKPRWQYHLEKKCRAPPSALDGSQLPPIPWAVPDDIREIHWADSSLAPLFKRAKSESQSDIHSGGKVEGKCF